MELTDAAIQAYAVWRGAQFKWGKQCDFVNMFEWARVIPPFTKPEGADDLHARDFGPAFLGLRMVDWVNQPDELPCVPRLTDTVTLHRRQSDEWMVNHRLVWTRGRDCASMGFRQIC